MGVAALVGAQFGSEGKGAIAAAVAKEFHAHVRVGAANAGHTVYTFLHDTLCSEPQREKHVLQQIPCAAYTNPAATLLIGPGAQISPHTLLAEVKRNAEWREHHRLQRLHLIIDPRAHLIGDHHIEKEQATDLADRIGSTSTKAREGIGVAQAARVMREAECKEFGHAHDLFRDLYHLCDAEMQDVTRCIHELAQRGDVLLEGTQGTGLSLTTGPFPFCTSRNTTASGLAADCGVGPRDIDRVILVARTYPIRVAGNSGPFAKGSKETTWFKLGLPPETTTVTKLERRVATFSLEQVEEAARLNSATEIALTFCDYICSALAGGTAINPEIANGPGSGLAKLEEMTLDIEGATDCEVRYWGTGPHSVIDRQVHGDCNCDYDSLTGRHEPSCPFIQPR